MARGLDQTVLPDGPSGAKNACRVVAVAEPFGMARICNWSLTTATVWPLPTARLGEAGNSGELADIAGPVNVSAARRPGEPVGVVRSSRDSTRKDVERGRTGLR